MQHERQQFRITDYLEFDSSGRAQCPCCLQDGKEGKNLSVTTSGPYEGAYKCFRGCSSEHIREALGQPKSNVIPTAQARPPAQKGLVSQTKVEEEHQTLLNSNGPALQWLANRGITREMVAHFKLGISRCRIGKARTYAISIPIPTGSGHYYQKKRVCPWDTDLHQQTDYKKWKQYGIPAMVTFTHHPDQAKETWLCEGEWDAIMLGWLAKDEPEIAVATFTCGAGSIPNPLELDKLPGTVISFYDQNDRPDKSGRTAAAKGEEKLAKALGHRYQVGVPPMNEGETKEGYDVNDAILSGFTIEDFWAAAKCSTATADDQDAKPKRKSLRDILTWNDELVARAPDYTNWLVDGILTSNEMFLLAAGPRCGKSLFAMTLVHSVSTGEPFLGRPVTQGTVFYVHCEDSEGKIKERQSNQGWSEGLPIAWFHRFKISESLSELHQLIREHDVRLVVLDTLSRVKDATVSESSAEMSHLLEPIQEMAQQEDCTVLLVHHVGKLQAESASEVDIFDRIRGSSAIRATCRGSMVLASGEQNHRLLTENGWNKEDLRIRLNTVTTRWELIGRWTPAKNVPHKQQIIAYLKTITEASLEQIHANTGIPQKSLYQQLARLQVSENAEDKVLKRGSRRKYTYTLEHQTHIQLLNKVLKRPNVDPEKDTSHYSTKNNFHSMTPPLNLTHVTDTCDSRWSVDGHLLKSETPCPEGDTGEGGRKLVEPPKHTLLNIDKKEGLNPMVDTDSAYSTTIQQEPFVEYKSEKVTNVSSEKVTNECPIRPNFDQSDQILTNRDQSSTCNDKHFDVWLYHSEKDTLVKLIKRNSKTSRVEIPGEGAKTVDNALLSHEMIPIGQELYKVVQRGDKWLHVVKGQRGRKKYGYNLETKELVELKTDADG